MKDGKEVILMQIKNILLLILKHLSHERRKRSDFDANFKMPNFRFWSNLGESSNGEKRGLDAI